MQQMQVGTVKWPILSHINLISKIKNAVNQLLTASVGMTGFEYFSQIIYIQYINTSVFLNSPVNSPVKFYCGKSYNKNKKLLNNIFSTYFSEKIVRRIYRDI